MDVLLWDSGWAKIPSRPWGHLVGREGKGEKALGAGCSDWSLGSALKYTFSSPSSYSSAHCCSVMLFPSTSLLSCNAGQHAVLLPPHCLLLLPELSMALSLWTDACKLTKFHKQKSSWWLPMSPNLEKSPTGLNSLLRKGTFYKLNAEYFIYNIYLYVNTMICYHKVELWYAYS